MSKELFLEKVKSEGLSHLSYILGHKGQAVVIDPRRDGQVYLDIARRRGCRITHIFETHRNEDYVIGSRDLAERTGAAIHHGEGIDWGYGQDVAEGDEVSFGAGVLRVLQTPGHTFESISLVLEDRNSGDGPLAVFTGDALFLGDVGRTDFFPDRAREVAGLLYDSIFEKLLPLGDHVLLYPAHGAGSVCGAGMAKREFSTLGYERLHNPAIQVSDREAFIERKVAETHDKPPYFKKMEEYNQRGNAPSMPALPWPTPLSAEALWDLASDGATVLDTRSVEAYASANIGGSLSIPLEMVPSFAGWFLDYDKPILLVPEQPGDVETAVRYLVRIGFDRVEGFLAESMEDWETSGLPFESVSPVGARDLRARLDRNEEFTLLDVRDQGEYASNHVPQATHIPLKELDGRVDELPPDRPVVTFCGSGRRAMIAASLLKRRGFEQVGDNLGSMAAWASVDGPTKQAPSS